MLNPLGLGFEAGLTLASGLGLETVVGLSLERSVRLC